MFFITTILFMLCIFHFQMYDMRERKIMQACCVSGFAINIKKKKI